MKIEAGKLYRTRDGRKAFVARFGYDLSFSGLIEGNLAADYWYPSGRSFDEDEPHLDLVAEWDEAPAWQPIKTAERRPEDGQRVFYWFEPSARWFVGEFNSAGPGFSGRAGFCDIHDAPWWHPMMPGPEGST
jgi:hypothetical protein